MDTLEILTALLFLKNEWLGRSQRERSLYELNLQLVSWSHRVDIHVFAAGTSGGGNGADGVGVGRRHGRTGIVAEAVLSVALGVTSRVLEVSRNVLVALSIACGSDREATLDHGDVAHDSSCDRNAYEGNMSLCRIGKSRSLSVGYIGFVALLTLLFGYSFS